MRIFLEAGAGFNKGKDVYGREIIGSADSEAIVKSCAAFLSLQKEIRERDIEVLQTKDAVERLEDINADDLLVSVHVNFYRDPSGEGLRGFYRSSRKHNSEKCKALAITVTKGLHDHIDLYYHGVFNEQRNGSSALESVVQSRGLGALVEVGFSDGNKDMINNAMLSKNIGDGIGIGIIRHLSALH
ncbi:hypothetical protein F9K33_02520 [bacterium]|nr:MAG: hypothetical protein F9K33_02520 [bacterium]